VGMYDVSLVRTLCQHIAAEQDAQKSRDLLGAVIFENN
jgi:hypothetical protein